MACVASIFWDFNLPNSTTWFYFSFLLAMALFFKFSRLLSMRNWDVLTLFLLVPGLLLLQEARRPERSPAVAVARMVGNTASQTVLAPSTALVSPAVLNAPDPGLSGPRLLWLGYLILLLGSAYLFCRCLIDLFLVQRPALGPNLNLGGLAWLGGALFICLVAVAYRAEEQPRPIAPVKTATPSADPKSDPVGPESASLTIVQEPFALVAKRTFAVLCHLAVVVGLIAIGYLHFQDGAAGMAAATFYLMLPYTGLYVGQVHHVWPMVLVIWALVAYRWPMLAGTLLGLAAATAYFPALVLPLWISFYWRRGAGRFIVAAGLTAGLWLLAIGLYLALTGDLTAQLRDSFDWLPWKPSHTEGFWTGLHSAYRIPLFIGYLAFVLLTAFWPYPKNLAHVLALSAAVILGVQFWYADQGGVYVLWYLPLLMLLVFRPNLADRRAVDINPDTDWFTRLQRTLGRFLSRWLKPKEPLARVS